MIDVWFAFDFSLGVMEIAVTGWSAWYNRIGSDVMTITVDATYENGILKPEQPLPLSERAKVRVTVEGPGDSPSLPPLSLANLFDAIEGDVGIFDGPRDQAAELDHYLYGAPKAERSHGG